MQHIRFLEVNAAKACGGVTFSLESKSVEINFDLLIAFKRKGV